MWDLELFRLSLILFDKMHCDMPEHRPYKIYLISPTAINNAYISARLGDFPVPGTIISLLR